MWIFLNDAFLSIVDKGPDDGALLVRARRPGEIARVFPGALEEATPHNDYAFRARIPREAVASTLAARVRDIDYPNFKGSVAEEERHAAYARVWGAMERFQRAGKG